METQNSRLARAAEPLLAHVHILISCHLTDSSHQWVYVYFCYFLYLPRALTFAFFLLGIPSPAYLKPISTHPSISIKNVLSSSDEVSSPPSPSDHQ